MTGFFLRVAIVALGLWLATQIFAGTAFRGPRHVVAAALLLGIVNAIVRPIAVILTLPLTLLSLGLFLLVDQCGHARAGRAAAGRISDQRLLDRRRCVADRQHHLVACLRPDRQQRQVRSHDRRARVTARRLLRDALSARRDRDPIQHATDHGEDRPGRPASPNCKRCGQRQHVGALD